MKHLGFKVTNGDHTRICSIGNSPLMDLGTAPDKETVECMLMKYLVKDEDLNPMEVFHFCNWCITFYNNYRNSGGPIQVNIIEFISPNTFKPIKK